MSLCVIRYDYDTIITKNHNYQFDFDFSSKPVISVGLLCIDSDEVAAD